MCNDGLDDDDADTAAEGRTSTVSEQLSSLSTTTTTTTTSKYFSPTQSKSSQKGCSCTSSKYFSPKQQSSGSSNKPPRLLESIVRYSSLFDALHGGDVSEVKDFLLIAYIHFGKCPTFCNAFDALLKIHSELELTPTIIEDALIQSVRHLCSDECFLRAYHAIREWAVMCRDLIGNNNSSKSRPPSPLDLSGWICKILPVRDENNSSKRRRLPHQFSHDGSGIEFDTKAEAIKFFNGNRQRGLCTLEHSPTPRAQLVDMTHNINNLYSPLGKKLNKGPMPQLVHPLTFFCLPIFF